MPRTYTKPWVVLKISVVHDEHFYFRSYEFVSGLTKKLPGFIDGSDIKVFFFVIKCMF